MNRTTAYRPRHVQQRRKKTAGRRVAARGQRDQSLLRLVICGAIFVFLVALKLLLPGAVNTLAQSAEELLGRDADFTEAFAAVGRAVSGEEGAADSLQDAYTAVFGPVEIPVEESGQEEMPVAEKAQTASDMNLPEKSGSDMEMTAAEDTGVERVVGQQQQEMPNAEEPAVSGQEEIVVTDSISYVYTMPPLPENASLDQRNLGFAYTTPLVGTMTSPFGWREHPIEGEDKFHYGLDLAANTGTDICAFADGRVYATGESSTLGLYIMLEHENGYGTLYAHCDRIVVTGGAVTKGQKIAEVGETGAATGPHLHFELHDGSLYLNPIYYVEVG